jgi:hypothetical protein
MLVIVVETKASVEDKKKVPHCTVQFSDNGNAEIEINLTDSTFMNPLKIAGSTELILPVANTAAYVIAARDVTISKDTTLVGERSKVLLSLPPRWHRTRTTATRASSPFRHTGRRETSPDEAIQASTRP